MKNQKVIHLYSRSPNNPFPPQSSPYYYLAGWASLQARECVKYDKKIKHEIWRPEPECDNPATRFVEGVTCRLFPVKASKRLRMIPHLMIKELKKECEQNQVIIVNLHSLHSLDTMRVIYLFRKYPIFIHHHGSIPWRYKHCKTWKKKIRNLAFAPVDEYILKWVDHFSVISITEKQYLEKHINSGNVALEQGRKHYDQWKPIDKRVARDKLGVPLDKKILIYVGYYYRLKGVDVLLNVFSKLKHEFDIGLLMIGGTPNDELYQDVIKTEGVMDFGRVPNDEMNLYYSSADVCCTGAMENTWVNFGGLGTAQIEALACNRPVVSKQLIHFPGDVWKMVGEIPEDSDDLYMKIKKVLQNPNLYKPREFSRKHYDCQAIIKRNIITYKKLLKRYYEKDYISTKNE